MVTLNYLRVCHNCGNVFSKKVVNETIKHCPVCKYEPKEHGVTLE